jgi:hypothetical protein
MSTISCPLWDSCGCVSCCTISGPAETLLSFSCTLNRCLSGSNANAPTHLNLLQASRNVPIAPRVHTTRIILKYCLHSDPSRCRRPTDVHVPSIPRCISALMWAVTIEGGLGWATSVPTAIPAAARGANATARPARATSWRRTARSSTANKPRSNASYVAWPAWLRAWVSAPRRVSSRSLPPRCCTGWPRRPSSCTLFPHFSSATSTWSSGNSTRCTRCYEVSKRVRSATMRLSQRLERSPS